MKIATAFLFWVSFLSTLYAVDFLGFEIDTPFGLAPCPISLSEGIQHYAQCGCDVLTYKTIRSIATPPHKAPCFLPLDYTEQLNEKELAIPLSISETTSSTWANSFGIGCNSLEWVKQDIQKAKTSLWPHQVLVVPIYGQQTSTKKIEQDFADLALFAKQAGADIIEANLSCPNLLSNKGLLYNDIKLIESVCTAICKAIGPTPLMVKIGYIKDYNELETVVKTIANGGAKAVVSMNALPMHVVNKTGAPAFGPNRKQCGVSGDALRTLALTQIKDIADINIQNNLGLSIIGAGGIIQPEHVQEFLDAGATVALSATGLMTHPNLAKEVQKEQLILQLYRHGIIKFGNFTLKSGIQSPIYFDLRALISFPDLLALVTHRMQTVCDTLTFDLLCGVPYGALAFAATTAFLTKKPMIIKRKEIKKHGTGKQIEGAFQPGQHCLIIEDVITSGGSCLETIEVLKQEGLVVENIIVIMEQKEGAETLKNMGYTVHSLFNFDDVSACLKKFSLFF